MPSRFFPAPYDRATKILSAMVCVALLGAAFAIQNPIVWCVSVLVIGLGYAYSPRGYTVADRAITVQRLIGEVRIPLENVQDARAATKEDFRATVRLFGSGGLFGYYGLFRTAPLGRCTWYMTDRSRAVVVIAAAKTALFSPDDRDGFLAAIREQAPVQGVVSAPPFADARPRTALTAAIVVAVALGLAGLIAVIAAVRYDPGPPPYTLTRDSLVIHDLFYSVTLDPASVDTSGVRVVDLSEEEGWRPAARTNGFANGHYQSGWYNAVNGTKMRFYRSGGRRLVLIPSKGGEAPVLLQVADPDQFVAQLRMEWASR